MPPSTPTRWSLTIGAAISAAQLLQWAIEPAGFRNSPGFKKLIVRLGASDFSCDPPKLKTGP